MGCAIFQILHFVHVFMNFVSSRNSEREGVLANVCVCVRERGSEGVRE